MKTNWKLTYETIPGNGQQTKKYKSFAEAKKDIKEMISKIYISPYTEAIREAGIHKIYRTTMADFLDNYVARKDFLSENDAIPSWDADDYELERKIIQNDVDEDVDDDGWYNEDEEVDELDDFEIYVGEDSISFDYCPDDSLHLYTDMVIMDDETKDYCFHFYVDRAPKNKLKELMMTLTPLQYWGTSSYPILILRTLEKSLMPLDQKEIISYIEAAYDTSIERKAVGRNITLLRDLGYDIRHNSEGYYISKEPPLLEQADFQRLVGIINASEELDGQHKGELINKLFSLSQCTIFDSQ